MTAPLTPMDCPKFVSCSAPVCPFDSNALKCHHHTGEPVCLYLREHVKTGGPARVLAALRPEQYQAIAGMLQTLHDPSAAGPRGVAKLRYELARAATKGSKMAQVDRLAKRAAA